MRLIYIFLSILFYVGLHQSAFTQIHTYAGESVLNTGNWYKIGTTETGVYRLDQAFLSNLGINASSINPQNIRLFGNGGGMLPQANSADRHDDLVENAIIVMGEEDGSFDANDYILFYGEAPHVWKYKEDKDLFDHQYHLYADTNFYYITIGDAPGKRIQVDSNSPMPTYTPTSFRGTAFYEKDLENPEKSGRYWLGEAFSSIVNTRSFSLHIPNADENGEIRMRIRVASDANRSTSFRILSGDRLVGTASFSAISNSAIASAYLAKTLSYSLPVSDLTGDSLRIRLEYNASGSADARSWLDWIEVDYDQKLTSIAGDMFHFHLTEGIGTGQIAGINIGDDTYNIWDVSNPLDVKVLNVAQGELSVEANTLKTFIAFKDNYLSAFSKGRVIRQNLHGLDLADYLIITHPDFRTEAERLGQFHRDFYGRTVHVVTPQEIYHEFSSGKQDVSAIRNFIKMFYDQSGGQLPGFVMLFGDGTYDYKGIIKDPTNQEPTGRNFIPTYQSRNSWSPVNSYTSDDFFVILEDDEGFWGENVRMTGDSYLLDDDNRVQVNTLDAAIGRLPIENIEQARTIVDKIINYVTNTDGLGTWRNKLVLIADHREGEGSTHVGQADSYTNTILQNNPCMNLEKIYMDNYPAESTPSGIKFPKGKEALLSSLDEGSLIVNYTGHGGSSAWSHADILLANDIQDIQNTHRLPAYITATCSFGHYDDPDARSGAETLLMMENNRGAIAMFTTVRLVYSSPNARLNSNLYREIFKFDEDKKRMPTVGEVMMKTKNETFNLGSTTNINSRNFTLLGDPGVILNYPSLKARIASINNQPVVNGAVDTLRSLAKVTLSGVIEDALGNTVPDYNGELNVTVFDKPSKFVTRLSNFPFFWQTNRLFNGRVTVMNGKFQFSFVVPIDVSYDEGRGKISLYFSGGDQDGGGCYSDMFIGGTDVTAIPDKEGPAIELFINDENWVDGGITDPNPYLYAKVSDPSGINTAGSSIGHEIIGVLDGDEGNAIILNQYYTAQKDDYSQGEVRYQMRDLEDGEHQLMVRVWDGANNPAEAFTDFIVVSDEKMVLGQILNVPNPVTSDTEFWISHNRASKELEATVNIYNVAGQLVKELNASFFASGNQYRIRWDGNNDIGNPVDNGVYVYQVILKDANSGQEVSEVKRLVLLR